MSIRASYKRITPQEFFEVQNNPELAKSIFEYDLLEDVDLTDVEAIAAKFQERKANPHYFSLEKEWHSLHFLLTGNSSLQEDNILSTPEYNVVLGGTKTQFEATYGFVRYLNPDEVKEVAELLNSISVEELKQRFDSTVFDEMKIYPNPLPGGWNEEQIQPLFTMYPKLVKFFQNAAEDGDIILLSSD